MKRIFGPIGASWFVVMGACATHPTHRDAGVVHDAAVQGDAGGASVHDGGRGFDAAHADGGRDAQSGCVSDAGDCGVSGTCAPGSCSKHGMCSGQVCSCAAGYQGASCASCASGFHAGNTAGSCTDSKCDPNPCTGALVCEPTAGKCCACLVGTTECQNSSQRQCVIDANGCGQWMPFVSCGAAGCADATHCDVGTRVQIDQWGEGDVDEIHSLAVASNGELIVAGRTYGPLEGQTALGMSDLFVSGRYPLQQTQPWTREWGTAKDDGAQGVVVDGSGNVFVVGSESGTRLFGTPGLSKWRPDHTLEWDKPWAQPTQDLLVDLAMDDTGNLITTGQTSGNVQGQNAGGYDVFVSKLDATGSLQWSVQVGTTDEDVPAQLTAVAGGVSYVVGCTRGALDSTATPAGGSDVFVMKLNASGAVQWVSQWGSSSDDCGEDIVALSGGDLLIVGYTRGLLPSATGSGGAFVARLDAAGKPSWVKQFGASGNDIAYRLALGPNNTAYIGGVTGGDLVPGAHKVGDDIFVQARDLSGVVTWTQQFGSNNTDSLRALAVGSDGTVYAGGTTAGSYPGFVVNGRWDNVLVTIHP